MVGHCEPRFSHITKKDPGMAYDHDDCFFVLPERILAVVKVAQYK